MSSSATEQDRQRNQRQSNNNQHNNGSYLHTNHNSPHTHHDSHINPPSHSHINPPSQPSHINPPSRHQGGPQQQHHYQQQQQQQQYDPSKPYQGDQYPGYTGNGQGQYTVPATIGSTMPPTSGTTYIPSHYDHSGAPSAYYQPAPSQQSQNGYGQPPGTPSSAQYSQPAGHQEYQQQQQQPPSQQLRAPRVTPSQQQPPQAQPQPPHHQPQIPEYQLQPSSSSFQRSTAQQPHEHGRVGFYIIGKVIGSGAFCKVYLGIHEFTGMRVAIKVLNRKELRQLDMGERFRTEIHILRTLNHPHVIRILEVIDTPKNIYTVMELIQGGELFQRIVSRGKFSEPEARVIFQQLISALSYCHAHNIVHRDLKPENILCVGDGDGPIHIKVADFGLSAMMSDGALLHTSCGSPNYGSPEVIGGEPYCGPEVDVWSAGVVLFACLVGSLPFDDDNIRTLFRKIKTGMFEMPSTLSPAAKDLLLGLICVDPVKRLTMDQIQRHPWVAQSLPLYLSIDGPSWDSIRNDIDHRIVQRIVQNFGVAADYVYDSLAMGPELTTSRRYAELAHLRTIAVIYNLYRLESDQQQDHLLAQYGIQYDLNRYLSLLVAKRKEQPRLALYYPETGSIPYMPMNLQQYTMDDQLQLIDSPESPSHMAVQPAPPPATARPHHSQDPVPVSILSTSGQHQHVVLQGNGSEGTRFLSLPPHYRRQIFASIKERQRTQEQQQQQQQQQQLKQQQRRRRLDTHGNPDEYGADSAHHKDDIDGGHRHSQQSQASHQSATAPDPDTDADTVEDDTHQTHRTDITLSTTITIPDRDSHSFETSSLYNVPTRELSSHATFHGRWYIGYWSPLLPAEVITCLFLTLKDYNIIWKYNQVDEIHAKSQHGTFIARHYASSKQHCIVDLTYVSGPLIVMTALLSDILHDFRLHLYHAKQQQASYMSLSSTTHAGMSSTTPSQQKPSDAHGKHSMNDDPSLQLSYVQQLQLQHQQELEDQEEEQRLQQRLVYAQFALSQLQDSQAFEQQIFSMSGVGQDRQSDTEGHAMPPSTGGVGEAAPVFMGADASGPDHIRTSSDMDGRDESHHTTGYNHEEMQQQQQQQQQHADGTRITDGTKQLQTIVPSVEEGEAPEPSTQQQQQQQQQQQRSATTRSEHDSKQASSHPHSRQAIERVYQRIGAILAKHQVSALTADDVIGLLADFSPDLQTKLLKSDSVLERYIILLVQQQQQSQGQQASTGAPIAATSGAQETETHRVDPQQQQPQQPSTTTPLPSQQQPQQQPTQQQLLTSTSTDELIQQLSRLSSNELVQQYRYYHETYVVGYQEFTALSSKPNPDPTRVQELYQYLQHVAAVLNAMQTIQQGRQAQGHPPPPSD